MAWKERDRLAAPPITSTATTTAAATAVTAAAPTAAAALFARTRFVDSQGATFEVLAVEHGDGFSCILLRGHFDEPETARFAGGPVLHDINGIDGPRLREQILQVVFRHIEGEVSHEQFCTHNINAVSRC